MSSQFVHYSFFGLINFVSFKFFLAQTPNSNDLDQLTLSHKLWACIKVRAEALKPFSRPHSDIRLRLFLPDSSWNVCIISSPNERPDVFLLPNVHEQRF